MSEGAGAVQSQKTWAKQNDTVALKKVRNKQDELRQLIENLSDKLSAVKHDQENEFLSAYRVHMLNVQLELKELGGKVAKAEEFLQDDSEVSKLEEECKWFRDETNRLQTNVTQMTNDMAQMRTRLTALNEQKAYLSDQLKQTMKRSRVLQTEVDIISQREMGSHSVAPSVGGPRRLDGGPSFDGSDQLDPLSPSGASQQRSMNKAQSASALPSAQTKGKRLGSSASEAVIGNTARRAQKDHADEAIRAALRSGHSRGASRGGSRGAMGDGGGFAVDTLVPRANKNSKRSGFAAARGSAEAHLHELQDLEECRSDLELKLEQYIGHVFNRVLERKARHSAQVAGRSKRQVTSGSQNFNDSQLLGSDGPTDQVSVTASQILSDTAHDPAGLTGLGLHYFTESDRFQCMCLLLSDPTVFSQVVEEMQKRLVF